LTRLSLPAIFTNLVFAPDLAQLGCIGGPAIVEQMDSTTVIHPGQDARIDGFGNIIIEINGD
jgi:N-methylhydantoinase A/oxoprolinase/acetone carboxylase beta subunit